MHKLRRPDSLDPLNEICSVIGDTQNKIMIEVGCYIGESTRVWASNFKKVYALDPWLKGKGYDSSDVVSESMSIEVEYEFDKNLKDFNNVSKIVDFSYNFSKILANQSVDFIYIDACHQYKDVLQDIKLFLPKVKSGGYIGGHDYNPPTPGVIQAVNECFDRKQIFSDSSWIHYIL